MPGAPRELTLRGAGAGAAAPRTAGPTRRAAVCAPPCVGLCGQGLQCRTRSADAGSHPPIHEHRGWGNNELEYYTDSADNVAVSNGQLAITALQQATNGFSYSSGRIITQNLVGFCPGAADSSGNTYGTISVEVAVQAPTPGAWSVDAEPWRAPAPLCEGGRLGPVAARACRCRDSGFGPVRIAGPGLWPAVWLSPVNLTYGAWPASGEVRRRLGPGNRRIWAGLLAGCAGLAVSAGLQCLLGGPPPVGPAGKETFPCFRLGRAHRQRRLSCAPQPPPRPQKD